jgi:phosphoribosylformylglycinamidine (FGAM) synthase-like enzyme
MWSSETHNHEEATMPAPKPTLAEMLSFAKDYQELGWAVQQQLDSLSDGDLDDLNTNAVTMIRDFVDNAAQTMDVDEDSFDDLTATCEDVLRHAAAASDEVAS